MTDFIVVLSTAGSEEEAKKIADNLVEGKLAACVNWWKINSVYTWKGKIERDCEYILFCKTTRDRYGDVETRIKELHSYECPEIIALPVGDGSSEYLEWILGNVGK